MHTASLEFIFVVEWSLIRKEITWFVPYLYAISTTVKSFFEPSCELKFTRALDCCRYDKTDEGPQAILAKDRGQNNDAVRGLVTRKSIIK
jgi:hypothetical protein